MLGVWLLLCTFLRSIADGDLGVGWKEEALSGLLPLLTLVCMSEILPFKLPLEWTFATADICLH